MAVSRQYWRLSQFRAGVVLGVLCLSCRHDANGPPEPSGGIASVVVTAARSTLAPGDTLRLTAQVMDGDGRVLPNAAVTWSSTTAAVASVDAGGLVTADSIGATTIVATAGGREGVTDLLVFPSVLCECTVVMDSSKVQLVSRDDSTGTYVFQVIRGPPPEIEVGSILVGAEDGGYLRRVDQVAIAGSRITVETSFAYLEEAVRDGGFLGTAFSDDESGTPAPGRDWWGPWTTTYLAPGVSLRSGTCCSLNDLQLQFQIQPSPNIPAGGQLTFTVKDGDVTFSPRIDVGAQVRFGSLTEFHSIIGGNLDLDIRNYEVKFTGIVTKGFEPIGKESQTFIIQQRPYATFIGPMPVLVIFTKKISLVVTPTVSLSAVINGSLSAGFGLTAGVRWNDGPGFRGVGSATSHFSATAPVFSGAEGSVQLKIAVVPEYNIQFYGVFGPFINVEPYAEGAATTVVSFDPNLAVSGWDWETRVDLGINLNLGAKLTILGRKDLATFGVQIPIVHPYRLVQDFSDGSLQVRNEASGDDIPSGFNLRLRPAWDPATGPKVAPLGRNQETSTRDTLLPANDSIVLDRIRSGPGAPHQLDLIDVPANCAVTNPRPDTLAINSDLFISHGGVPSDTLFQVHCIPLGDLGVMVTATGPQQPARYRATMLRADTVGTGKADSALTINVSADTVIEDFAPLNPASGSSGRLDVTLEQPRRNCAVVNPATHQVVILSGDTVTTGFGVTCVPHGAVRIHTATTDPDPDPSPGAGAALSYLPALTPAAPIDTVLAPPGNVGATDSTVVTDLVPLYNASGAPGRYTVALAQAPNRCVEAAQYQRSVTVFSGDTAVADFVIQCVERLQVRTITSGPGTDPDGYLIVVVHPDGSADSVPAGINQVTGIAGLVPGDHTILLADVEPSCTAPAPVTRAISGSDSTLVTLSAGCPAPPPPAGLRSTLIATDRIDLAWDPVTSGGVALYRIYRNGVLHDSTTGTTFSDLGLPPFTQFAYQVSSVNTTGLEGARTRPVLVRTGDATPPSAPTNLAATPVNSGRIDLAWSAATDPETGILRYRIYRDAVLLDSTTGTAFIDGNLAAGTPYSYEVSAVNGDGLEGPRTPPALATTPGAGTVTLVVTTASTGRTPAGYTVQVSGASGSLTQPIDASGSVNFIGLASGDYTVELLAVPSNCTVTDPNPRLITLPPGSVSVATQFNVVCEK
jgi:hypothetical protein